MLDIVGGGKEKLISDVLVWTRSHKHLMDKTYIHQLCVNTGCHIEDLPGAMVDKDLWQ